MTAGQDHAEPDVTIIEYPGGPLVVRGNFEVRTLDGTVSVTGPVTALCRCGRSGRKPLCDGTHRKPLGRRTGQPSNGSP